METKFIDRHRFQMIFFIEYCGLTFQLLSLMQIPGQLSLQVASCAFCNGDCFRGTKKLTLAHDVYDLIHSHCSIGNLFLGTQRRALGNTCRVMPQLKSKLLLRRLFQREYIGEAPKICAVVVI